MREKNYFKLEAKSRLGHFLRLSTVILKTGADSDEQGQDTLHFGNF